MWSFLQKLLWPTPRPPTRTFTAAKFPADGSAPSLVHLTTTVDSNGPDCYLCPVPDLRACWKGIAQAWAWRDIEEFNFEDQPNERWNGVYVKWFSFAADHLPENTNVPLLFCHRSRLGAGDVFVAKIGSSEMDEHRWTVYHDFEAGFLEYCLAKDAREIDEYCRLRDQKIGVLAARFNDDFDRSGWLDEIYRARQGVVDLGLEGGQTGARLG